jgi:hypothetical protein
MSRVTFGREQMRLHTNFGAATKSLIKGGGASVYSIVASNGNAAVRYFQLHNKVTIPLANEVPVISIAVFGSQTVHLSNGELLAIPVGSSDGVAGAGLFPDGLGWAWSTTQATFTDAATAADHGTHVFYE